MTDEQEVLDAFFSMDAECQGEILKLMRTTGKRNQAKRLASVALASSRRGDNNLLKPVSKVINHHLALVANGAVVRK